MIRDEIAEFLWDTYRPATWVKWKQASNLDLIGSTLQQADKLLTLEVNSIPLSDLVKLAESVKEGQSLEVVESEYPTAR